MQTFPPTLICCERLQREYTEKVLWFLPFPSLLRALPRCSPTSPCVLSSVAFCFLCCFTRTPAEQEQNSFFSFPSPQVTLCPGKCHCHRAMWAKTRGELLSFTNSSEKMQRRSSQSKGRPPVAAASVLVARTVLLRKLIIKRQVFCFKGTCKILDVLPLKQFLQSP